MGWPHRLHMHTVTYRVQYEENGFRLLTQDDLPKWPLGRGAMRDRQNVTSMVMFQPDSLGFWRMGGKPPPHRAVGDIR